MVVRVVAPSTGSGPRAKSNGQRAQGVLRTSRATSLRRCLVWISVSHTAHFLLGRWPISAWYGDIREKDRFDFRGASGVVSLLSRRGPAPARGTITFLP